MRLLFFIACLGFPLSNAYAETGSAQVAPFQLGSVFPDPSGILFPGLATAAAINPAALGNAGKATAIQVALTPSLRSGDDNEYFASFATAKKGFGFGFGIDGATKGGGSFTNGGFVGMGFNLERIALGLAVRDANFSDSVSPSVDVGALFGESQGLKLGFVFYHLENSPQLDLGIGWGAGKKYNLEANVLLPPFSSFSGGSLGMSLGANIFIQPLSFLFRTTYYTRSNNYVHTLGVGVWLNQMFNLGVQFSSPRHWTFGLTLVL